MDNAQKAIMIGVGLFITILIIAAVMLIVNVALGVIGSGTDQIISLNKTLEAMLYQDYDGTTVTGAEVISFAQRYAEDERMVVEIKTNDTTILELGKVKGNGTTSLDKATKYDNDSDRTKVSEISNSSNVEKYVPLTARYDAQLVKSSSGDTVMGVIFTRK